MDLITVRHYLQERRIVSLQDIATHFRVDAQTIRPLLDIWIKKGKAKRITDANAACACCAECESAKVETYQWVGWVEDNG